MDIVLFGIQGSGKGTQAKRLAEEFGYEIFEAGGALRNIKASGTELGKEVASYIDVGKLVPHEIIMKVVQDWVQARPADQTVIFDGIPRDMNQMRDFDTVMKEAGREYTCVHTLLDPEEGIERILGRAKTEGRTDDIDADVIRKRMDTFVEKTLPVIEFYKEQGNMCEIDGHGTKDEIYERLKGCVV